MGLISLISPFIELSWFREKIVQTVKDYCFLKTAVKSSAKSIVNWLPLTLIVIITYKLHCRPTYGIRGGYYFRITKLDTVLKSTTALMRS